MNWAWHLTTISMAMNVVLVVANGILFWLNGRRLYRCILAFRLLEEICVAAFRRDCRVWLAWALMMSAIEFEVGGVDVRVTATMREAKANENHG